MKWILASGLALGLLWPVGPVRAQETSSNTLYTNKTKFRIPFRFDAEEIRRLNAREIRLFVSFDQGLTWQLSQAVDAQTGRFDFQAPSDGGYWFAVQTIDGMNQAHPATEQLSAGLKVVVDSAPPQLDIQLQSLPGGKVKLKWESFDPNLDVKSLKMEFIQSGDNQWHAVNVLPLEDGETSWTVTAGAEVAVRGSIQDRSGNIGTSQSQIKIDSDNAGPAPKGPAPDFTQPIANGNPAPLAEPQANNDTLIITPGKSSRREPTVADSQFSEDLPFKTETPMLAAPVEDLLSSSPDSSADFSGITDPAQSAISSAAPMPDDILDPVEPEEPLPSATAIPPGTLVRDLPQFRPDVMKGRYSPAGVNNQPAGTSQRRVINNLKFNIGYRIEDVGPSGVSAVELFITQNDGEKWYKYGNDPDKQSPFMVEVPEEGTYGFAIRVHSGVGLTDDPPQPGEKPVIEVQIDQTAPKLELLPVQQGKGEKLNQLTIRWNAEDNSLADKPISIAYASNPQGPWESIAGWIENTGSYSWNIGPGAPAKLYLQITARDRAGNINQTVTPQPIVIDMSRPSARIVDVESLDDSTSPF
ncbi:MAG: hypothetical protein ACKVT0_08715 [Planctomycetaceae bacterium]